MRHLIFGILWTILTILMIDLTIYDACMGRHGMAIFTAFCAIVDAIDAYLAFRRWKEWRQLKKLFSHSSSKNDQSI